MRRSLVLSDETARHPFLASLPPHVRKGEEAVPARHWLSLTKDDISGFATAYAACFIAVLVFII